MRRIPAVIIVTFGLVCFFSCHKETVYPLNEKYQYFPVDSGHYVIYDIDSVTYNGDYSPPLIDTVRFQLMELVQSIFLDNSGRPTDRIERYRRPDSTYAWTIWDVWTATRTINTAERYEDNLRFVKLVFPPNIGATWQGNEYLDIDSTSSSLNWMAGWNYQIATVDVPANINGYSFDSTLTVLEDSNQNLIQYTYEKDVYATNVGLVYKRQLNLTAATPTDSFPAGANNGFIYTMQVHGYHQ